MNVHLTRARAGGSAPTAAAIRQGKITDRCLPLPVARVQEPDCHQHCLQPVPLHFLCRQSCPPGQHVSRVVRVLVFTMLTAVCVGEEVRGHSGDSRILSTASGTADSQRVSDAVAKCVAVRCHLSAASSVPSASVFASLNTLSVCWSVYSTLGTTSVCWSVSSVYSTLNIHLSALSPLSILLSISVCLLVSLLCLFYSRYPSVCWPVSSICATSVRAIYLLCLPIDW